MLVLAIAMSGDSAWPWRPPGTNFLLWGHDRRGPMTVNWVAGSVGSYPDDVWPFLAAYHGAHIRQLAVVMAPARS